MDCHIPRAATNLRFAAFHFWQKERMFRNEPIRSSSSPTESHLNSGQGWLQSWLMAQPQEVTSIKLCLVRIFSLANAPACGSMRFNCWLNDQRRCHQFPPALRSEGRRNTKPCTKPRFLMLSVQSIQSRSQAWLGFCFICLWS